LIASVVSTQALGYISNSYIQFSAPVKHEAWKEQPALVTRETNPILSRQAGPWATIGNPALAIRVCYPSRYP